MGLCHCVICIYPPPFILVAIATKFETKMAITRLYERYVLDLYIYWKVFGVRLLNDVSRIEPRFTLVAMTTKNFEKVDDSGGQPTLTQTF